MEKISSAEKNAIIDGFKAILHSIEVDTMRGAIENYEHFDAIMDDISTEISARSGVDVRKNGMESALHAILGNEKYASAINKVCQYYCAKILKDAMMERVKKYE